MTRIALVLAASLSLASLGDSVQSPPQQPGKDSAPQLTKEPSLADVVGKLDQAGGTEQITFAPLRTPNDLEASQRRQSSSGRSEADGSDSAAWPQWGGPMRDFQVAAKGLANQWPKDGPRTIWSRPLGEGHSAICVEGDAMYTMFSQGEQEIVVVAAVATGKTLWEHRYDSPTKGMDLGEGKGPHATPLLVGDLLFTVGTIGKMHALDKRTGKVVWFHDLWGELGGTKLDQGYACSPIAYKDTVIVTVGGRGQAVVAFRQKDGAIAWKKHDFAKSPA